MFLTSGTFPLLPNNKVMSMSIHPLFGLDILLLATLFMYCSSATSYNLNDRPTLKYGTAWKKGMSCLVYCAHNYVLTNSSVKDDTADLVEKAILAGFRHIDTACQPRHYHEAGVGYGWTAAAKKLGLERKDIWLQTKFSGLNAHDPNNVPYDKHAPLEERVKQSLEKSLANLQTDYLDSWLMQ